jgi:hypothetical protein
MAVVAKSSETISSVGSKTIASIGKGKLGEFDFLHFNFRGDGVDKSVKLK